MIIKSQIGVFIAGSNPIFDANALNTLADLHVEYQFIGGTGFGAVAACFAAAKQTKVLVEHLDEISADNNEFAGNFIRFVFKSRAIPKYLDTLALRASAVPVLIPAMHQQFFALETLDARKIEEKEFLTKVLTANNTAIDSFGSDRLEFDGGLIDVYTPLMQMVEAGAERLILITSALPETTNERVFKQYVRRARYNEVIRALCMAQARSPYLQVHLVAPTIPTLVTSDSKQSKDQQAKQGIEIARKILSGFNVNPPNPECTAWSAVDALHTLADRFTRSTGIELSRMGATNQE